MKTLKRLLITVLVLGMSVGFNTVTYASEITNEIQTQSEFYYDGLSTEAQEEMIAKIEKYCEIRDPAIFSLDLHQINNTANILGAVAGTTKSITLAGLLTTMFAVIPALSQNPIAIKIFMASAIATLVAGLTTTLSINIKKYYKNRYNNDVHNNEIEDYLKLLCND